MGRVQQACRRSCREAFTLVELLVVIGIIAVLISALLPSLNKARQAANQLDCQARLQQMGSALQIYVHQNKGLLPWSAIHNNGPWTDSVLPSASNQEDIWYWFETLSEILNKNIFGSDGFVRNLSPIFRDRDTVDVPDDVRYVCHYTVNPRVLYRDDTPETAPRVFFGGEEISIADPNPYKRLTQRKISSVRQSSNVFVIWDAPQLMDRTDPAAPPPGNAYPIAESLDAWGWYNTSALCYDTPVSSVVIGRAILPGSQGVTGRQPGKAFQIKYNFDALTAFGGGGWLSHLRFRHMNNTKLCALCLDGHVETRRAGEVMVKDVFTNYR